MHGPLEKRAVGRRLAFAVTPLIALAALAALTLALSAAPARPAPLEIPGCERNLAEAFAGITEMQARLKTIRARRGPEICSATRLYFLELVKARAITALCKRGAERERDLGQLDADVEQTNDAIASICG